MSRRRTGHRPRRSCLGCGARDDQSSMLRLVVGDGGVMKVDRLGNGRGGYLHNDEKCWQAFIRRKNVYRAFHLEIGKATKEKLVEELRRKHLE